MSFILSHRHYNFSIAANIAKNCNIYKDLVIFFIYLAQTKGNVHLEKEMYKTIMMRQNGASLSL